MNEFDVCVLCKVEHTSCISNNVKTMKVTQFSSSHYFNQATSWNSKNQNNAECQTANINPKVWSNDDNKVCIKCISNICRCYKSIEGLFTKHVDLHWLGEYFYIDFMFTVLNSYHALVRCISVLHHIFFQDKSSWMRVHKLMVGTELSDSYDQQAGDFIVLH